MLEIIAIAICCKSLGDMLRHRGRKPLLFQILFVLSWFACQFLFAFGFCVVWVIVKNAEPEFFIAYFAALVGAASSSIFWFVVASMLPNLQATQPVRHWEPLPDHLHASGFAPPPDFGPPVDPSNPYAPPRSQR